MDLQTVTRMVDVDGKVFPVAEYGEGPAVLLLHGFPDSRHLWRYQIPAIAEAGLRVIATDLPGLGDAPKPASVEAYRVSTVAKDMVALLDTLQVGETGIVGTIGARL